MHTYELAPNSAAAAAAGKVWRRQPNFGRRAGAPAGFGSRQPENGRRRGWGVYSLPSLSPSFSCPFPFLLSPPLPYSLPFLPFPTSFFPFPSPSLSFSSLRSRAPLNQLGFFWGVGSGAGIEFGKRIWCTLELLVSHWWQSFWVFWSARFVVDRWSKFSTN